jgi:hypothetical protein
MLGFQLKSRLSLTKLLCIYSTFRCNQVHFGRAVRPTPQEFHNYDLYLIITKSAVIYTSLAGKMPAPQDLTILGLYNLAA